MAICNLITRIGEQECIGDSLIKINNNFNNLQSLTCDLSAKFPVGTNDIQDNAVVTAKIPNNAIIESKIANNQVTNAKLRQSAGLSVIGRSASSLGNPADITAATDGHVLRRSGTSIGFGQIATAGIANSAVTEPKIANGAVTTNKIADSNITTQKLSNNAVIESKIANNAVTTNKIVDGAVIAAKIPNNTITPQKLSNNDDQGFNSFPIYGVRAWGLVRGGNGEILRGSKNISRNTTGGRRTVLESPGIYRVSFTTDMPVNNYGLIITPQDSGDIAFQGDHIACIIEKTSTYFRVRTIDTLIGNMASRNNGNGQVGDANPGGVEYRDARQKPGSQNTTFSFMVIF